MDDDETVLCAGCLRTSGVSDKSKPLVLCLLGCWCWHCSLAVAAAVVLVVDFFPVRLQENEGQ